MTTPGTVDPAPVPAAPPRGQSRPVSSVMQDLLVAAFSGVLVLGLFLDGRAHELGLVDSFFTACHALLYSGFLLTAAAVAAVIWRHRSGRSLPLAIPYGYGWSLVGIALFGVGGIADMGWHVAFGVEAGLDALLSPTHLVLFGSGLLLVTGPVRALLKRSEDGALPRGWRELGPVMLATTWATAIVAFALAYVSAFHTDAPTKRVGHFPDGTAAHVATELPAVAAVGSYLVTTLLLVVPFLLVARRVRPPVGSVTVLVTILAFLSVTVTDFRNASSVAAAFVGGVAADAILARGRSTGRARRGPVLAAAGALAGLTWATQFLLFALGSGLGWSAELVGGVTALTIIAAVAAGWLVTPARSPLPVDPRLVRRAADSPVGVVS